MKNDKLGLSPFPLLGHVKFGELAAQRATPDLGPYVVQAVKSDVIREIRDDIATDLWPVSERS